MDNLATRYENANREEEAKPLREEPATLKEGGESTRKPVVAAAETRVPDAAAPPAPAKTGEIKLLGGALSSTVLVDGENRR